MVIPPLTWLAICIYMEARGEPYEGKLGVGYVIMNRVNSSRFPKTVGDVVWQSYQFSWTNPTDPNRLNLDSINENDPVYIECHKAACAAYYQLTPDPTGGANHYLNVALVKAMRADGELPAWVSKMKKTAEIGKHTFFASTP